MRMRMGPLAASCQHASMHHGIMLHAVIRVCGQQLCQYMFPCMLVPILHYCYLMHCTLVWAPAAVRWRHRRPRRLAGGRLVLQRRTHGPSRPRPAHRPQRGRHVRSGTHAMRIHPCACSACINSDSITKSLLWDPA